MKEKHDLENRIKRIDEQIALLTDLKTQCLQKLQSVRTVPCAEMATPPQGMTLDDKIVLFLNYFRGRIDVYSKLWINNRTGKRGYSPACKNEWVQNICKKPAIR